MTALIIIGLALIIVFIIWMAIYLEENNLHENWQIIVLKMILFFGIFLFAVGMSIYFEKDGKESGYKEGQSDALNGKFKYERQFVIPEGDSIIVDTLYIEL